jgi:hypothetical membrane protein
MLTILAILTAAVGFLLILFLVWREEKAESGAVETQLLAANGVLVALVGVWQVIANLSH